LTIDIPEDAMDFYKLINTRRSVRRYSTREVEEDRVNRILDAARLAPSAANKQPWHFIVVKDARQKQELGKAYGREWFYTAPVLICACGESAKAWSRSFDGKNHVDVDVAIAMDHLILAAAEEGLGTCWICAFDPAIARKALGLPAGIEPIAFTPVGYAEDEPVPKARKKLEEIVRYEKW
jgi:nitroreductase